MNSSATFLPLIEGLRDHGISRGRGYELINAGLLDTFTLGRRRYVMLESLRTLPQRCAGISREELLAAGRERRQRAA